MLTPPLLTFSRWREVECVPIHDQCRVDQSAVEEEHRALPFRLHQQDQVFGRDTHGLPGCFELNPRLLMLRAHPAGTCDQAPGR
jgi:hypothetical protein